MADVSVLKKQFNQILTRITNAEIYFKSSAVDIEKDNWVPEFWELLRQGCDIINQIERSSYIVSENEMLHGFQID